MERNERKAGDAGGRGLCLNSDSVINGIGERFWMEFDVRDVILDYWFCTETCGVCIEAVCIRIIIMY